MKILYSGLAVSILLALATISRGAVIDWAPPRAHVLRFTLMSCDVTCRCGPACVYIHYSRGRLYCPLIQRNQTGRRFYFEGRLGFLNTGDAGHTIPDDVSNQSGEECNSLEPPFCPDLRADSAVVVLDNLSTIGNSQNIHLSWLPGQHGWNGTTSCAAAAQCSDYGTRIRQVAMGEHCQLATECRDRETECRDGQCVCKPGLSHDSDNMACV